MNCLGRTKTSNFLNRCSRSTRFLFCRQHVWQPVSAVVALVVVGAAVSEFSGFSLRDLIGNGSRAAPSSEIKIYFSAFYSAGQPTTDFELRRGERTLLFVRIPRLKEPANRFVLGRAIVRPVNLGSRSMSGAELTTIFADALWHPSLGELDRDSVTPLFSAHEFNLDVRRVDSRWLATRKLPRLDPMSGVPLPVSFLLEFHAVTPQGELSREASGEVEIKMIGADWIGVSHVIDIHCIPADSFEAFLASSRAVASSLRSRGYPNVPVVLAETGGGSMVPVEGGPTIIEARIETFVEFERRMLRDF